MRISPLFQRMSSKSRWEKKQKDKSVVLTDTSKNNNEYVLFNSNGIYMQVLEHGLWRLYQDLVKLQMYWCVSMNTTSIPVPRSVMIHGS